LKKKFYFGVRDWCSSLTDATFWVYILFFFFYFVETIRSFHRDNSKYLFALLCKRQEKYERNWFMRDVCVQPCFVECRFIFHRENQINNEPVTTGSSSWTNKPTQFFFLYLKKKKENSSYFVLLLLLFQKSQCWYQPTGIIKWYGVVSLKKKLSL
jgi:hypothetical protein